VLILRYSSRRSKIRDVRRYKNLSKVILSVSKKTGIPTKKISDFFYYIRKGEPVDNNLSIQELGLSRNSLNQAKEILSSYLLPPSKNTQLKAKVVNEVKDFFSRGYLPDGAMWNFLKTRQYRETLEFIRQKVSSRPNPERKFDQFFATTQTTAKRACLMDYLADIEGKRILFLGDDDFTSVAVANFHTASEVSVMEIDERIRNGIFSVSKKEGLGIKLFDYDARKAFPASQLKRYDIVFTDPPYTEKGVQLFTSRAIEALDSSNHSARIYVCYGSSDSAKEKFLEIYDIFAKSRLMLRFIFDKFNRYKGAESIGDSSSLFIADVTANTKPIITGKHDKKIYTHN